MRNTSALNLPIQFLQSPTPDYTSMLVFSPSSIPDILQRVIVNAKPSLYPIDSRSAPANTLYFLARFACIHCDDSWFDALMTSALDCIEETTYVSEPHTVMLPFSSPPFTRHDLMAVKTFHIQHSGYIMPLSSYTSFDAIDP